MQAEQIEITGETIDGALDIALSKKRCPHGRTLWLARRGDPLRQCVCRVGCGSWECRICGQWKRLKAGRHFARKFVAWDGPIYETAYAPADWSAVKRKAQRSAGQWVRVAVDAERGVIFSTSPLNARSVRHADLMAAVRRLGVVLRAVVPTRKRKNVRPVSSSVGWKIGEQPGQYERLAVVAAREAEPLAEHLKRQGITGKLYGPSGGRQFALAFRVPEAGAAALVDSLRAVLLPVRVSAAGLSHFPGWAERGFSPSPEKATPALHWGSDPHEQVFSLLERAA